MEKQYENNIELFDAYLNNTMNDADRGELEKQLNDNEALRKEFQNHKLFVATLQATCSETNQEFEKAMKNISDKDFQLIIDEKKLDSTHKEETKSKERMVPLKTVYRWMGAAAVALLIVGLGSTFVKYAASDQMDYQPDSSSLYADLVDPVVNSYQFEEISSRSAGDSNSEDNKFNTAIKLLKEDKNKKAINILEELYQNSKPDDQLKEEFATTLAYAYAKDGDKKNARRIINESKETNNGKTPETLKKLEKVLEALEVLDELEDNIEN